MDSLLHILTSIGCYFAADPLRVLYVIGGSGGVVVWYDRFRSRIWLDVSVTEDAEEREEGQLFFNIQNNGRETALRRGIRLTYYTPKGVSKKAIYDLRELATDLPPFTRKEFSASARDPEALRGAPRWFRTYTFTPVHGRKKRYRVLAWDLEPVGRAIFLLKLLAFRLNLPRWHRDGSGTSRNEWLASRRRRGPH